MVTRREVLAGVIAAGATASLTGCAPLAARLRQKHPVTPLKGWTVSHSRGVRFFGRATFGHRPGDLEGYDKAGHEATLEQLLAAKEPEDPTLLAQINRLEVFRMDGPELEDWHREELVRQLQQASVLRACYGANPLKERMVNFWNDHLNIYGEKELDAFRKGRDEETVVRKHALGNFPEMIKASAQSPAMLNYLDNERNRKGAPNENYARELMELHTMGVDGGYTQKDIQEVARCFTGWTVENRFLRRKGSFWFDPDRHDDGQKVVLGHTIGPGGGESDGHRVLDIVTSHPSTARFLSKKLALYFVGQRENELETEIAKAYVVSRGNIAAMLKVLFGHAAFWGAPPMIKRPLDLLASSVRALDATTDGGPELLKHLADMGQAAYEWPMPDGYPVRNTAWLGSMLPRWNYALAYGNGVIKGTTTDLVSVSVRDQIEALYGRRLSSADDDLVREVQESGIGVAVASPEYQYK